MQVLCRTCNLKKGKGIHIEPYIKLGISPDYIMIRCDFPTNAFTSKAYCELMRQLFIRNENCFNRSEDFDAPRTDNFEVNLPEQEDGYIEN